MPIIDGRIPLAEGGETVITVETDDRHEEGAEAPAQAAPAPAEEPVEHIATEDSAVIDRRPPEGEQPRPQAKRVARMSGSLVVGKSDQSAAEAARTGDDGEGRDDDEEEEPPFVLPYDGADDDLTSLVESKQLSASEAEPEAGAGGGSGGKDVDKPPTGGDGDGENGDNGGDDRPEGEEPEQPPAANALPPRERPTRGSLNPRDHEALLRNEETEPEVLENSVNLPSARAEYHRTQDSEGKEVIQVTELDVSPPLRGFGIGTKMMRTLADKAVENGAAFLQAETPTEGAIRVAAHAFGENVTFYKAAEIPDTPEERAAAQISPRAALDIVNTRAEHAAEDPESEDMTQYGVSARVDLQAYARQERIEATRPVFKELPPETEMEREQRVDLEAEYDNRFREPVEALQDEVDLLASPDQHPDYIGTGGGPDTPGLHAFRVDAETDEEVDLDAPPDVRYVVRLYPQTAEAEEFRDLRDREARRVRALQRGLNVAAPYRADVERLVALNRESRMPVTWHIPAPAVQGLPPSAIEGITHNVLARARDTIYAMTDAGIVPNENLGQGEGVLFDTRGGEGRLKFVGYDLEESEGPRQAQARRAAAAASFDRLHIGICLQLDTQDPAQAALLRRINQDYSDLR